MLTYLYANQLDAYPHLKRSLFRDRASQFRDRLDWDVTVDAQGFEKDQYDAQNPLYVIWRNAQGRHGGSMRVLPTTAPCMVNDFFSDIAGGKIISPLIWESTRFCLAPDVGANAGRISAALMLAGCEIGLNFGLKHAVGVFDPRMVRIYRTLGWSPEILGAQGKGRDKIYVGLWEFSQSIRQGLAQKAGISTELSQHWFDRTFGTTVAQKACA